MDVKFARTACAEHAAQRVWEWKCVLSIAVGPSHVGNAIQMATS